MGSDALVQARIDKDVKERAARVLAKQGMSLADAIRLLLAHVAEQQKLPFEADVPNAETRAAMQELERGAISPDEPVTLTIEPELIPGRRESRKLVIAAGLTDDDIDRLIKRAQQEVESLLPR